MRHEHGEVETLCAKCVFALCIRDLVMVIPEIDYKPELRSAKEED